VPDLYLDSQALTDFAGRLQSLAGDFKTPIYFEDACTDALNDNLASFSTDDAACGSSLNNYLTSLSGFASQAAAAAQHMDEQMAAEATQAHRFPHMRAI
jgi:hypothetical protein